MEIYQKSLANFEKSYFAFATLSIIGQSCLGSIAAMYTLYNGTSPFQMIQLAIIVTICMSVNTGILAQLSSKMVLIWLSQVLFQVYSLSL